MKAIKSMNPDFLVATEVMGQESISVLAEKHLEGKYKTVLAPSNNSNLNIGFLYRSELKLKVEILSYEFLKVFNELKGEFETAFVQTLPFFIVSDEVTGEILTAVVGVHFKSERDRAFDPSSFLKRTQEADLTVELIKEFKSVYKETPVIVMGDFNAGNLGTELNGFTYELGFSNPFVQDFADPYGMGRKTHTYHTDDGGVFLSSPDRAYVDPMIARNAISARVHRYRNKKGKVKPFPKTIQERGLNPSDHYPIYFDIRL